MLEAALDELDRLSQSLRLTVSRGTRGDDLEAMANAGRLVTEHAEGLAGWLDGDGFLPRKWAVG